jgi:hypothetical protein
MARFRVHTARPILRSTHFKASLFGKVAAAKCPVVELNLFFLTAWNEWNQQSVLEIDTILIQYLARQT